MSKKKKQDYTVLIIVGLVLLVGIVFLYLNTSTEGQATAKATPKITPTRTITMLNLWSDIKIYFPSDLQTIKAGTSAFHQLKIIEKDTTPAEDNEGFAVEAKISMSGQVAYPISYTAKTSYNSGYWEVNMPSLNPGTYELTVRVICTGNPCLTNYQSGYTQKSEVFLVQ